MEPPILTDRRAGETHRESWSPPWFHDSWVFDALRLAALWISLWGKLQMAVAERS